MRCGFTMIELMAVLILLALVAAVGATIDTRAATHSPARVWHRLEQELQRCSALAIEHGGGELRLTDLSFTYHNDGEPVRMRALDMPAQWALRGRNEDALRIDARGRCRDAVLKIVGAGRTTVSTAVLDGVSLTITRQDDTP